MEAYLLLEVAQSNRQISLMRKDLTYEIVHHNTIALQLNRIMLERMERDLHAADELVGHVHLTIRQTGHSAAFKHAMQESWPCHSQTGKFLFLSLALNYNDGMQICQPCPPLLMLS